MKSLAAAIFILILGGGCATRQRDFFYTLDAQPPGVRDSQASFDRQVTLRVTVPSIVDRGEMVLTTQDGIAVIDRERWAAPLADLMRTTLGQDIERRRTDVVVLPRGSEQPGVTLLQIAVDVDQVRARLGDQVSIEVHWRVIDARNGKSAVGRDVFVSPSSSSSYAGVASALSACIGLLADRLVKEIPGG
jgi:uncharacterized protein